VTQDRWAPVAAGLVGGLVAGLFGVGGGVVLVPIMVLLLRRPQHVAHATSLVAIVVPAAVGAVRFAAAGEVAWAGAAAVAVGAVGGVQLGAALLSRVTARWLRLLFAALLALAALRLLLGGEGGGTDLPAIEPGAGSFLLHALLGLAIGAVSALLGIGGGTLLVPALVVLLGYGQHLAEGTSLATVVPTALLGAAANARHGYTDWWLGWRLGAGGLVGVLAGAELALSLPGPVLARAFGVLLAVVAGVLVARTNDGHPETSADRQLTLGGPEGGGPPPEEP
jgi:uncharacterized membrane protein YfcA